MVGDPAPFLASLILLALAGGGCRVPRVSLGPIGVPDQAVPEARPMAIGRRVVMVADPVTQTSSSEGPWIQVLVRLFPADAVVKGQVGTRVLSEGRFVADARASLQPELRTGFTFTWQGRAQPDTLEVVGTQLCVGDDCEDLIVQIPLTTRR